MFSKLHNYLRKNNISLFWFYCVISILIIGALGSDGSSSNTNGPTASGSTSIITNNQKEEKQVPVKQEAVFNLSEYIQDNKSSAKFACHEAAKQLLKAPSTAKFASIVDTTITTNVGNQDIKKVFPNDDINANTFSFVSYVDAQNSFGAPIRSTIVCLFEYDASIKDSTLKNVVIE